MAFQKITTAVLAIWFMLATILVTAQGESPASPPSPTQSGAPVGLASFESMLVGLVSVAISFLICNCT